MKIQDLNEKVDEKVLSSSTYSPGISSHTSNNKHEEETNDKLQSKSLTMSSRRNSDSSTHYGMENPLERKRST